LGRKTDNEVAAIIGRSADSVRLHRKLLGIPIKPENRPWTAREESWLGKLHDAEIARRMGRSQVSVQARRLRLGLSLKTPKRRPWTPEEEKLLVLSKRFSPSRRPAR
jgi:hypothetical protein